jgi:hypothetical protein
MAIALPATYTNSMVDIDAIMLTFFRFDTFNLNYHWRFAANSQLMFINFIWKMILITKLSISITESMGLISKFLKLLILIS